MALGGFNLEVAAGEIVGLLGPNGAGKSTCIQHVLGLLSPDEGSVEIFGSSPLRLETRRLIGCTPQDSGFLEHVTVRETLALVAAHYPNPANVDEMLSRFGLENLAQRKTTALSGGQRRCLSLACAFVGKPQLVLLDEPTTGLDVDIRGRLWEVMREFASGGGTILLTTHYLEEAEALASRIVVVRNGKVFFSGDVSTIKAQLGVKRVDFFSDDNVKVHAAKIEKRGRQYQVWTADPDQFVRELVENHSFSGLEVRSVSLEEAFLMLMAEAGS